MASSEAAMAEDSNIEDDQLASMSTDDILKASRLLDNEIRVLKRNTLELESFKEKIKENQEKIKLNKQLPYLSQHRRVKQKYNFVFELTV
ncbi:26S protease regulatory subunit 6A [Ananas comosus]|uniref:26S protease regulatory subunit 6A n=1 Tax=Ananas comosus TaxID=4615 RepID=A0A199UT01_ANACO|nr:26S protease regulatory subunit 6A [Ananas comosus]